MKDKRKATLARVRQRGLPRPPLGAYGFSKTDPATPKNSLVLMLAVRSLPRLDRFALALLLRWGLALAASSRGGWPLVRSGRLRAMRCSGIVRCMMRRDGVFVLASFVACPVGRSLGYVSVRRMRACMFSFG